MATKLQKRVARELEQLTADVAAGVVELDERGKVEIDDPEFGDLSGAALRERADAPRLTVATRTAAWEIARRKLNKSL